jgi:aldehyde oxidoreductase
LEGRRTYKNRFRHPRKTRREIMKQYLRKSIRVNGYPHHVVASPDTMLVNIIRKQLGLTGTKLGCGSGQCGACEVIMNGKLMRSCIVRWDRVPEDAEILTIEGLGTPDKLHALQWAYVKTGAIQCGFCTPGFIMSSKALLDENLNPTREEV